MAQPLHDTHFLVSASDARTLGVCHAEVAFVGRSNVGKSSLLNALAGQRQLARVSKTPGRTRLINVFLTGPDRWIVDLPGYGFAAGPREESDSWRDMVEGYLLSRKTLQVVFILIDAEVGPTKLDHQMIDWLSSTGLAYRIVATKADQVKPSKVLSQRKAIASAFGLHPQDIAWVSSSKGTGVPELRKDVATLLAL